ncbi:MAG: hypothetical protein JXM68_06490, partial [Sedimentisphaerales bacterium]|nr:hypothetical protein [Sedimentisphaerales bacterium]
GSSSFLGEIWFAKAPAPQGPWTKAVKIITHDNYTFYNVCHHPEFNNGSLLYLEGTYCETYTGNDDLTPRYNYNQIMYELDLNDPGIKLLQP